MPPKFLLSGIFLLAGLCMMFFRPKKINNWYGYRTSSSMKNQEAWDVAQRCSAKLSIVFGFLGLAVETILLFLFPELPLERYILYFIVPYALVTPLFIIVVTELAIRKAAKLSTHGGPSVVKAAIAMTAVWGLSFASLAGTDAALIGIWSGKLAAGFQVLDVVFHIDGDYCSLDVPAQGAAGVKGVLKSAKAEAVELEFKAIGGRFEGRLQDGKLAGKWSQGMGTLPLTLSVLRRSQDPKPPFPYHTEEVAFANADAKLRGTLTIPENGDRKTPVLILLTGSGLQNRDSEIFGHRPFAVIADFLARRGIATLRYDDRGIGGSTGKLKDISIEDIAQDAASGVEFLRGRFDTVGVLGHSEGGTVAFMLAAQSKVDFVISMAGSALKLGDVLDMQLREQLSAAGMSGKVLENELAAAKEKLIYDDGIRRYMEYDPVVAIKATHCPVLAVNGEKDVQVRADRHLPVLRANLAPKDRMTIKSYPKLNHLFQHCKTGAPTEYGQIDETMALEVLEDIAGFVGKFGGEKAKM